MHAGPDAQGPDERGVKQLVPAERDEEHRTTLPERAGRHADAAVMDDGSGVGKEPIVRQKGSQQDVIDLDAGRQTVPGQVQPGVMTTMIRPDQFIDARAAFNLMAGPWSKGRRSLARAWSVTKWTRWSIRSASINW
jgi:hypothetical protein